MLFCFLQGPAGWPCHNKGSRLKSHPHDRAATCCGSVPCCCCRGRGCIWSAPWSAEHLGQPTGAPRCRPGPLNRRPLSGQPMGQPPAGPACPAAAAGHHAGAAPASRAPAAARVCGPPSQTAPSAQPGRAQSVVPHLMLAACCKEHMRSAGAANTAANEQFIDGKPVGGCYQRQFA